MTLNHTLAQVGFTVSDLDAAISHAEAVLGVEEVTRDDRAARLALPGQPTCLVLAAGERSTLDHMALRTSPANFEEIQVRAAAREVEIEEADELPGRAIRLRAPNGLPVEVGIAETPMLENDRLRPIGPTICSLDHLSLTAQDLDAAVGFFTDVLGFSVTDSVGDVRHWLRCGPNHHTVAIFEGPDGIQHYAFKAPDITHLQRLGDLLAIRGENFLWGPGRHNLGANIYSYHLDPAGSILEVCCDMIQVPSDEEWVAQVWPADSPASAVMWGQLPPPEFRQTNTPLAGAVEAGR